MNEKTTIRFVLTGVKYSQSDLGKHYKTFCGLYGCRTCQDPGVMQCPSVSPCFLSAFRCSFPRACAYIIMYPFCQTFHPP